MKKLILLPLLCFIFIGGYGQNYCGTVSSQASINKSIAVQSLVGCIDTPDDIIETEIIELNMILRYAKDGDGPGEISLSDRNEIESKVNSVFNPFDIYFNVIWAELNCLPCKEDFANWPDKIPSDFCIIGDVLAAETNVASGNQGSGAVGGGPFGHLKLTILSLMK